MGWFNRNKEKKYENGEYLAEMQRQAEARVVRKVAQLVLMKELVPEAKELAKELGVTEQEALIYLKAKEGIPENENGNEEPKNKSKESGFDWQGLLGNMGDYGGDIQNIGTGLMNIGLEGEGDVEQPKKTSRGRGQRKTKRAF